ncbi:unnamed protein product [Effrenium voratum]|uniref:EF-hand domain-containing protein n=1 Tax=Effrenium voratum TaxID=2562239 RepID=A0AA36JR59_9DINO|nr:unnamed protein product [Effrenium voratum]
MAAALLASVPVLDMRAVGPVLSACARCLRWQMALSLLLGLPLEVAPGPIAYNSVASACERASEWQHALALIQAMAANGLEMDAFSFCAGICACSKGQQWPEVFHLLRRMADTSVATSPVLCGAAVNACAKAARWDGALYLLAEMVKQSVERSTVAFSAAISACERSGLWAVALGLVSEMRQTQVPLDTIACSSAISACEKAQEWSFALATLAQMQCWDIEVDAVSLSAAISACEKSAKWDIALHLLGLWPVLGLQTSNVAFAATISACEKATQWTAAGNLLQRLLASRAEVDAFSCSATMAACSRAREWQAALQILDGMDHWKVTKDAVCYTAAISACASSSQWQAALTLLELMRLDVTAEQFAYSAALSACEAVGNWQQAVSLLWKMRQEELAPDGMHLGSAVATTFHSLGRAAAAELLKAFRRELPSSQISQISSAAAGVAHMVLKESPGLVVLNKPAGVLTEDLLAALGRHGRVTTISRLDAPTSGVLPVAIGAKNEPAVIWFKSQFAGRLAKKEYLCLCHGRHGRGLVGDCVSSPLRQVPGEPRTEISREGREAVTYYEMLAEYLPCENASLPEERLFLIRARPQTGRMHQIRVHMASIGLPIVGDRQYGRLPPSWCSRLFLHCHRLELMDWHEQELHVEAPLPADLQDLANELSKRQPEAQAQRVPQQVKRKRKVKLKKRVQLEEDPPEPDTEDPSQQNSSADKDSSPTLGRDKSRALAVTEGDVTVIAGSDQALNKRLEVARAKLESSRDHSFMRKVEHFLRIVLGRDGEDPDEETSQGDLRWLLFEAIAACLIAVNSVLMGFEVQYTSSSSEPSPVFLAGSIFFGVWFIVEVAIRFQANGFYTFFTSEDRWWNICDLFLVGVSVLDVILLLVGFASTALSSIRVLKMIRVVRLFRVFRFFRQLATLALMVADSVKQLLWALLMFLLIMYVFAITLTSSCTDWIKIHIDFSDPDWKQKLKNSDSEELRQVHRFFGDIPRSVYTLFQTTLGGISWYEVTDALLSVDIISFCLMFAYIIFTILALLNVFTGVFVDNAVQNSKKQRQIQIEETLEKKRMGLDQIIEFFVATDLNGDGTISLAEIQHLLQDPVMNAYFDIIGFRPGDAQMLADLLDRDGSGGITLSEFINGCERMKGQAKGIDVHLLLTECIQIHEKVDRLAADFHGVPYDCLQGKRRKTLTVVG